MAQPAVVGCKGKGRALRALGGSARVDGPAGRSSVLKGSVICFTGFRRAEREAIAREVAAMGGEFCANFTDSVTHLVALKPGSEKCTVARRLRTPIVLVDWVHECFRKGQLLSVEDFRVPIFLGCTISVTGLLFEARNELATSISDHGGSFCGHLDRQCTHLLADTPSGAKFEAARRWGISVVKSSWVADCVAENELLDVANYFLDGPPKFESVDCLDSSRNAKNSTAVCVEETILDGVEKPGEDLQPADESKEPAAGEPGVDRVLHYPDDDDDVLLDLFDGLHFYFCCSVDSEKERLIQWSVRCGATRLAAFDLSITHVIVGSGGASEVSMLSRLPEWHSPRVLSSRWLLECEAARSVLPTGKFEIRVEDLHKLDRRTSFSHVTASSKLFSTGIGASMIESVPSTAPSTRKLSIGGGCVRSSSSGLGAFGDGEDFCAGRQKAPEFLRGMKVAAVGLSENEEHSVSELVSAHGGIFCSVASSNAGKGETELDCGYVICGHGSAVAARIEELGLCARCAVCTIAWLEACAEEGRLLDPSENFLHAPLRVPLPLSGFESLKISVSNFLARERAELKQLMTLLGASYTSELGRPNSHLICDAPEGRKFEYAKRYGIPVVSRAWLVECAQVGRLVDCTRFLHTGSYVAGDVMQRSNANGAAVMPAEVQPAHAGRARLSLTPRRGKRRSGSVNPNMKLNFITPSVERSVDLPVHSPLLQGRSEDFSAEGFVVSAAAATDATADARDESTSAEPSSAALVADEGRPAAENATDLGFGVSKIRSLMMRGRAGSGRVESRKFLPQSSQLGSRSTQQPAVESGKVPRRLLADSTQGFPLSGRPKTRSSPRIRTPASTQQETTVKHVDAEGLVERKELLARLRSEKEQEHDAGYSGAAGPRPRGPNKTPSPSSKTARRRLVEKPPAKRVRER